MKAAILYWKLVIWRGGWRGVRAFLVTCFVGSNAVQWGSLGASEKFVLIAGGILAAGDAIDAYMDQTVLKSREGRELLNLPIDPEPQPQPTDERNSQR